MQNSCTLRIKILMASMAALIATGCAVPRAIESADQLAHKGRNEVAVETLLVAKQENPDDMRLDSAMYKQVDMLVRGYQQQADHALAAGDEETALEKLQSILKYDSGNMRARQTIDQLDSRRHLQQLLIEAKKIAEDQPEDALKLIQQVLEERPSWNEAVRIRDTLMRRIAESNTLSPSFDSSMKKPVSLTFRSHNLIGIFDVISELAGVNFIFDADVPKNATASISAKKTTAEDAINLLLVTNQLRKKVLNNNTLLIYPARANKEKEYRDMAVKTFFLSHGNAKSVSTALKMMIKIRDVHIDERINAVVVRDAPEILELASRLVQALDRPEAEVTLDVQVLEVGTNDLLNFGTQFPQTVNIGINGVANSNNLPLNMLSSLRKDNIFVNLGDQKGVTLNMLQQASQTQVLANPKIRVKNGKKAQIEIGQKIPVITNLMSDSGATSEKVEMLDVGLKFDVVPTISLDGEITVDIDLTVSSLGAFELSPKKAKYYRINQRKTKTTLTAKDNETQILAGLISREERDTKSGLPVVSQLPLLDRLFGTAQGSKEKSELVLVITPRIERKLELPGAHVTTFISGTESHISTDSLILRNTEGARVSTGGTGLRPAPVESAPDEPVLPDAIPALEPQLRTAPPGWIPPPLSGERPESEDRSEQLPRPSESTGIGSATIGSASVYMAPDHGALRTVALRSMSPRHGHPLPEPASVAESPTAPFGMADARQRASDSTAAMGHLLSMTMLLGMGGIIVPLSQFSRRIARPCLGKRRLTFLPWRWKAKQQAGTGETGRHEPSRQASAGTGRNAE